MLDTETVYTIAGIINTGSYPYLMTKLLNMYWEALSAITSVVGNSSFRFFVVVVQLGENSKYTINCIHIIKLKGQI